MNPMPPPPPTTDRPFAPAAAHPPGARPMNAGAWTSRLEKAWLPVLGIPLDAAAIAAGVGAAYWLRFRFSPFVELFPIPGGLPLPWVHYREALGTIVGLYLFMLAYAARAYQDPFLRLEDRAVRILNGTFQGTLVLLALTFLFHRIMDSRLTAVLVFPLASLTLLASHGLLHGAHRALLMRLSGGPGLLLLGTGQTAEILRRRLEKVRHTRLHATGPLTGKELLDRVGHLDIQEVILCQPTYSKAELVGLAETLESAGVQLRFVPSLLELRMGEVQIDQSLGLPIFRLHHVSLSGENFVLKRVFDLLFCLGVMAAGAIPFGAIALLIKLDSHGPVLYRQRRFGYKGRVFEAFKFRTMVADAEDRIEDLRAQADPGSPYFKLKTDPRITRVGRWLRRFSLDEAPQFLNVLRGEMSVVGPRPLAVATGEMSALEAQYGATARKMLNVLPGITGLWQVSGRSEVDGDTRFALDLYYIEHWSLGLDLKIILKTLPAMISTRGAY